MKLSVCMIVRDEGERLARALESVRGVADEVVVTDTGSRDETVRVAEKYGARVNRFEWCEDFAAARNACVAHARGEWVLWLDGDERLKPGTERGVLEDIADERMIAYQMIREEYFHTDRPDWFSEMYVLRLVRRDLPATFVGRIHEHLEPWPVDIANRTGKGVRVARTRLEHWGYTGERIPAKCARAAYLCELELKARPGQLYYLVEQARALLTIQTKETHAKAWEVLGEASAIMMRHREDLVPPSPLASSLIEQLLVLPGQTLVGVDELILLGRKWFPSSAPVVWAIARVYFERGDWAGAETGLRRLIALVGTGNHDHISPFDPRVLEDATFNLGVCLVRQSRLAEAEEVFVGLLGTMRRGEDARVNLEAVRGLRVRFGV